MARPKSMRVKPRLNKLEKPLDPFMHSVMVSTADGVEGVSRWALKIDSAINQVAVSENKGRSSGVDKAALGKFTTDKLDAIDIHAFFRELSVAGWCNLTVSQGTPLSVGNPTMAEGAGESISRVEGAA